MEIDGFYDTALAVALKRGIRSEKDQVKWLNDKGLWTKKDELRLIQDKAYIDNLRKTKANLFLKAQIAPIQKSLEEAIAKYESEIRKKQSLIGTTAEKATERKIQYEYLRLAFYKDPDLTDRVFTSKEVSKLDDEETELALSIYVDIISSLDNRAIRSISVAHYFTSAFYLSGESLSSFFGKPLCNLSFPQINLLTYATYFRNILKTNNVPDEWHENPDKLEDFINRRGNADKALNKAGSGRVGIVGATQEDFDNLNLRNDSDQMQGLIDKEYKEAKKAANDLGY